MQNLMTLSLRVLTFTPLWKWWEKQQDKSYPLQTLTFLPEVYLSEKIFKIMHFIELPNS